VSDRPSAVVVLVTPGCHLCADACAVVGAVCTDAGVSWSTRDLGELDDASQARWREFVPVVLIDGEVHDVFRVDAGRLRAALGKS
jgi:hypothetical protein